MAYSGSTPYHPSWHAHLPPSHSFYNISFDNTSTYENFYVNSNTHVFPLPKVFKPVVLYHKDSNENSDNSLKIKCSCDSCQNSFYSNCPVYAPKRVSDHNLMINSHPSKSSRTELSVSANEESGIQTSTKDSHENETPLHESINPAFLKPHFNPNQSSNYYLYGNDENWPRNVSVVQNLHHNLPPLHANTSYSYRTFLNEEENQVVQTQRNVHLDYNNNNNNNNISKVFDNSSPGSAQRLELSSADAVSSCGKWPFLCGTVSSNEPPIHHEIVVPNCNEMSLSTKELNYCNTDDNDESVPLVNHSTHNLLQRSNSGEIVKNRKKRKDPHSDAAPTTKLFRCVCGQTFARNEELTRHQRIHSGYKPHRCHICCKRFSRKDHLNKHAKTHLHSSQKKVHICNVPNCGQSYTRSDALARHQMNFHGIKIKPSKWRPQKRTI